MFDRGFELLIRNPQVAAYYRPVVLKVWYALPLVVRELPLVVRRGISELNINQAACPTKAFFFLIVLNGSVFFMLSTRAFFFLAREFKNVSTHHCHFLVS